MCPTAPFALITKVALNAYLLFTFTPTALASPVPRTVSPAPMLQIAPHASLAITYLLVSVFYVNLAVQCVSNLREDVLTVV